ncbi:unnamed protein product [Allacma fusca]|uniref:Major facilitator superfamily (MFS) profile domain-containing protein n=1 Tax=Allacma fusca TaxID=39272 RepID=A0A8J2PX59_9HEXA|nr:unnamed protein product [Allacma fusca]
MKKELIPLIDRRDNLTRRNQILTVAGVTLSLFATGNILGFSAVTLPSLLEEESEIRANSEDLSWIASMVTIGCIVGNFMGGLISDMIGRKKTIIFSSVVFFIGWMVIAEATTVAEILAGRVLTGLASGFYSTAVQVYICEIVEPSIRGASGSTPSLMVAIGIVSTYCLGSLLEWRTVALICSAFPLLVLSYVLFLPESPVWLVSKNREPEAMKSLTWLRNDSEEAEQECMRLQYLKERRVTRSFSVMNCCQRFSERSVLKPLFIGTMLFFFQQFSGIYPITFYATLIFRYADHFINDYLETICIGFVRMFFSLIAIFLINFFRRRTLLITSGLLMFLSNGLLGGYFYLRELEGQRLGISNESFAEPTVQFEVMVGSVSVEWVPLACLLLFMASYAVGFGIIPWFLMAELMPSDVRSVACSIAFAFGQICLFVAVKTFLQVIQLIDAQGTFWAYSGVSFMGVLFVVFFVPETSNLYDDEIEDIFQNKMNTEKHSGFVEDTDF